LYKISKELKKKIGKVSNKKVNIASLTPMQMKKIREYEEEMDVILIAYEKNKEA
jgi:hypothetical protein